MGLPQRLSKRWSSLVEWSEAIGWPQTAEWVALNTAIKFGSPKRSFMVKPRQAQHRVMARLGRSSDMNVLKEIFVWREYAGLTEVSSPKMIFDLGANVGYASAYMLTLFPEATVLAVEADPRNFELLRRNLAPYGDRAKPVLGAVWSSGRSKLRIDRGSFGDGREWATQVIEGDDNPETSVDGFDIPALMKLAGTQSIDILKVDIERSELAVFDSSSAQWLPYVRNIVIELHGPDCSEAFKKALNGFDYELSHRRQLTLCRNLIAHQRASA